MAGAVPAAWTVEAPFWIVLLTLGLLVAAVAVLLVYRRRSERMEQLVRVDELTGLANRRAFDAHLEREMARAKREGSTLSVALLDLDDFKGINDRHGHELGDEALRDVARTGDRILRDVDLIGRLGGDEFGVVLTNCTIDSAEDVLDRLREGLAGGRRCSAGVVSWDGAESAADLLRRADHALYEAKHIGGNCTVKGLGAWLDSELARSSDAPGAARRALEPLRTELGPSLINDLKLLVSELVTNSVKYGEGAIALRIWLTPQIVRAEIIDQGSGFSERLAAGPLPPHQGPGGWGLELLDKISHRWGTYPGSTHVWFELTREGANPAAERETADESASAAA